ncbi:MAG: FeoB-associated Cys-rich membrane protein [Verrucomicrobia bacterium]|nr:FeoB-associated Cys-rich membrane protein [Verrucomicrobiota bacterium]
MEFLDRILVFLVLGGAMVFLYRVFRRKKDKRGCGCGTDKCPTRKP